jgi:hypothetical protein
MKVIRKLGIDRRNEQTKQMVAQIPLGEGIEEGAGEMLRVGVKRGPGRGSSSTGRALARYTRESGASG